MRNLLRPLFSVFLALALVVSGAVHGLAQGIGPGGGDSLPPGWTALLICSAHGGTAEIILDANGNPVEHSPDIPGTLCTDCVMAGANGLATQTWAGLPPLPLSRMGAITSESLFVMRQPLRLGARGPPQKV